MYYIRFFVVIVFIFSLDISAQNGIKSKEFIFKGGLNLIDNTGDESPFPFSKDKLEYMGGGMPISFGVDYFIKKHLSVGLSLNYNRFRAGKSIIDGFSLSGDLSYFAVDFSLKYHFLRLHSPQSNISKFDLYGTCGAGFFNIGKTTGSLNLGLGMNYWISSTFGITTEYLSKFSFNGKDVESVPDTNHFYYFLGVAFRNVPNKRKPLNYKEFIFKGGLNLVDNTGDRKPFPFDGKKLENTAFSMPFSLGVDYLFRKDVSIGLSASYNKFKANKAVLDGYLLYSDLSYFAVDLSLKYYFLRLYSPQSYNSKFDMYGSGGLGFFNISKSTGSVNLGLGMNYWINSKIGITTEYLSKFSFNKSEIAYIPDTSHFYYFIGVAYRIGVGNRGANCNPSNAAF